mmetsp:Transcript_7669/g.24122  ORF Transcript_7669/g.24122 Transcript_7669/m.24122 type:complete len:219 (-) Transcript_7669:42-698(-)
MEKAQVVQGAVIEQPLDAIVVSPWPTKLCCYDNLNCGADLPLCCYAHFCTPCLWAEVADALAVDVVADPEQCAPSCNCTSRRCATACYAYCAYSCLQSITQSLLQGLGCQSVAGLVQIVPCLTMKTRQSLEVKQGLEVQCGNAYCADFWCSSCSAYQQAVFVKHVMRKDFECCTYQTCCKPYCACCSSPAPGEMVTRLSATPPGYAAVTTSQPVKGMV